MKIVIISHHFPPHYNAGGEQYAYRLAKYLLTSGHAVEVVCVESIEEGTLTPDCRTETYHNIPVHRLYFNLTGAPNRLELSFRNPHLGKWVKEYLRQTTPDLVHFNSGYLLGGTVIEAAKELAIPTVLTLHEYWFLCPTHTLFRPDGHLCAEPCPAQRCAWTLLLEKRRYRLPDQLLNHQLGELVTNLTKNKLLANLTGMQKDIQTIEERRSYLKKSLDLVDIILSPSHFLIRKFADFGFNTTRIHYQPFGLEQTPLFAAVPETRPDIHIGYMGQFADHKGIHILIQAFKHLNSPRKPVKLLLHGKLSNSNAYGKKIQALIAGRDDILVQGPFENAKVNQVLQNLDCLVVPSIWYENRPTVIVEALSAQTPVIASRIGGIPELVEHNKNGLLFETGSVEDLTAQLQRIITEPGLIAKLRQGIEPTYAIETEMRSILALYQSLIPAKGN